jgi:diguanylate cyclase (GGDEF)-like protein
VRFADFTRSAQVYIAAVCGLALVETVFAALQPSGGASIELFAMLVLAATVAHSFPVSVPGKHAYHVSLPFFIAAIILLAPLQLVALVGVIHVAESMRGRRSSVVQVFNAAAYALTGLIAQATYRALWPGQADLTANLSQPACLLAGLAAAFTFTLLNRVLISTAIWLGNRIPLRKQHTFELESVLTDGVLLLMGVPLAHLAQLAPWAAAAGAAPLWLIHRALELPNVRAQSRQDGLTELFTAPYLTETCTRELNRGRRFNRPVCLLLLDVDALGELNATHGHQTGDVVLRSTAQTISHALREYDLPARLAGGLFAVLLPETDLAQAQAVAERIRRASAEQRHEVPGTVEQARVTVSIGGAVVNGHNASASQLFDAAESALARAKRDGGNQISFEAVQAAMLAAVPADEETDAANRPEARVWEPAIRRRGGNRFGTAWLRQHGQSLLVGGLAALGLTVCVVGAVATLDWAMLGVMLSLSVLVGFAFYFKSLPLALALAGELNRSPARLAATGYGRLWPQYAALGIAGLLVFYAYGHLGLTAAIALGVLALVARHMAGRYVDRTLDSVRKLRTDNEALEHQAFHDALTGLPNRALFAERLEHAMLRAGDGNIAVLFVDLDNFKSVNDTLGHAAGDALLVGVAERLIDCVRREDTIARLGGDEFTVLLEDMRDPSDAARMAERIGETLRAPFELGGQQVSVSTSVGIALDTDRSHRPDDLLREADLAMYRAKTTGKARYEIFDPGMAERAMERLELETELRQAVARGEFELYYQPIVSLATGDVHAFEAQLVWQHPRRGLTELTEFRRVAEETGIIVDIGHWALERACQDAARWQTGRRGAAVQLDLTARQLEQPALADVVRSALDKAGLAPGHLYIEVPESAAICQAETVTSLREVGVRIALDDVGTGTSSLATLSRLPADVLKISAGPTGSTSTAFVRASVALGSALDMTVTVLGVEHADEAVRLATLGCSQAQGDLYGPALTADGVEALLAAAPAQIWAA